MTQPGKTKTGICLAVDVGSSIAFLAMLPGRGQHPYYPDKKTTYLTDNASLGSRAFFHP